MNPALCLTALALAPTAEKELMDIQRKVFHLSPSALALPPLRALRLDAAPPPPESLAAFRQTGGCAFRFTGYGQEENILFAAMPPALPQTHAFAASTENSPAYTSFAALTRREGFYIAGLNGIQPAQFACEELPPLPAFLVRTLRLLTLEILIAPAPSWWRGIEWTVVSEDWIKLEN
jgi:hypothetical protein